MTTDHLNQNLWEVRPTLSILSSPSIFPICSPGRESLTWSRGPQPPGSWTGTSSLSGTRPESREWAAGEWAKLRLYLELLPTLPASLSPIASRQMGPAGCRKAISGLPRILHCGELYSRFIIYHNVIITERKCTMRLSHSETIPTPPPPGDLWENCLPQNWVWCQKGWGPRA